jgi:hypothetical protein
VDYSTPCHRVNFSAACAHDIVAQQSERYAIAYLYNDRCDWRSWIFDEASYERKYERDFDDHDRVSLEIGAPEGLFTDIITGSPLSRWSLSEVRQALAAAGLQDD